MAGPYDKILTSVGLIDGGKISKQSRDAYIDDVISLLITGNKNGKGGGPRIQIFNSLVPLPPAPGPNVIDLSGKLEKLFWFDPDPYALLSRDVLNNNEKIWQKVFIDLLYESVAKLLDIQGATPLLPIFDITAGIPGKIQIKTSASLNETITLAIPTPDKLIELLKPTPPDPSGLLIKLADLNLKPAIPIPPTPVIPTTLISNIVAQVPNLSIGDLPPLTLQQLFTGLFKLPFTVLADVFSQVLNPQIPSKIPTLPSVVLELIMEGVLSLLITLGFVGGGSVPKLLIASLLVYVKNIVGIICVDLIGLLLGAGGILTKSIATLTGLI